MKKVNLHIQLITDCLVDMGIILFKKCYDIFKQIFDGFVLISSELKARKVLLCSGNTN